MKTEPPPITYATVRFAGDDLDPADISAVLAVNPDRAHRKGEAFFAGARAGHLRGRTGIWFLATDKRVPSSFLADHLRYLEDLLEPGGDSSKLGRLRTLIRNSRAEASFSIYWYGPAGVVPQTIPARFARLAGELDAFIEVNLDAEGATKLHTASAK